MGRASKPKPESRSGSIVFATEGGRLVVMNPDGSAKTTVLDTHRPRSPQLAPDGNSVVFGCHFGSSTDSRSQEICTIQTDGSRFRRLTRNGVVDFSPDWSPSGNRIAYVRGSKIMVMGKRGRHKRKVPGGSNSGLLGWRYSSRIVYGRGALDGGDIYSIRPDGSARRRITPKDKGDESEPQWSPDGRSIVFVRQVGLRYVDVFKMKANSKKAKRLTFNCCYKAYPTWSPRGNRIIFYNTGLDVMRSDGSHIRNLRKASKGREADWARS